jgi:hypothetical protein
MEDIAISRRLKRLSRPFCIATPVITSGRRWEHHGVIRTILLMWRLRLAFYLGVEPELLARRYGPHPALPRKRERVGIARSAAHRGAGP